MKTFHAASRKELLFTHVSEAQPAVKQAIADWLSYLWHKTLMLILSMILGVYIYALLGFLLIAFGVPIATIKLISIPCVAVIGFTLFLVCYFFDV